MQGVGHLHRGSGGRELALPWVLAKLGGGGYASMGTWERWGECPKAQGRDQWLHLSTGDGPGGSRWDLSWPGKNRLVLRGPFAGQRGHAVGPRMVGSVGLEDEGQGGFEALTSRGSLGKGEASSRRMGGGPASVWQRPRPRAAGSMGSALLRFCTRGSPPPPRKRVVAGGKGNRDVKSLHPETLGAMGRGCQAGGPHDNCLRFHFGVLLC